MLTSFNPQTFFDQATEYASQSRGHFSCTLGNGHFLRTAAAGNPELTEGINILSTGIAAKSFSIPSVQLSTYEPVSYNGPTRKFPHTLQFADLQIEFYLMGRTTREANALYHLMFNWLEGIAGKNFGNGMPSAYEDTFNIRYYETYIAEGEINIYSPNSPDSVNGKPKTITRVKFSEMYPTDISGIQTSWESSETPVTLSVTFAYYYHRVLPST